LNRTILKNITFAVIVVIVGVVLRSIDTLSLTRVWRWSLGDVVAWGSFTAAAAIAAYLAGEIGAPEGRPVLGSRALSRILGIVAFGAGMWLLHTAVKPVTTSAWLPIVQKIFAFGIVALAAYALWLAHQGFDEIARALAPVRPSAVATPQAPPAASRAAPPSQQAVACPQCGSTVPAGQRFCGTCGTSLPALS